MKGMRLPSGGKQKQKKLLLPSANRAKTALKFVQFYSANANTVFVLSVMVLTLQTASRYRSVKLSELFLLSLSVNLVHS